jgi:hypothetical protein
MSREVRSAHSCVQREVLRISGVRRDHPPAKVATLVKAVVIACDGLDGVSDGLISDVPACNNTYTIDTVRTTLRCPGGAGRSSHPKWPILEGPTFLSNHLGKSNAAQNPPVVPMDPVNRSAFGLLPGSGMIKGFVTRDFSVDPLAFDPNAWVPREPARAGASGPRAPRADDLV